MVDCKVTQDVVAGKNVVSIFMKKVFVADDIKPVANQYEKSVEKISKKDCFYLVVVLTESQLCSNGVLDVLADKTAIPSIQEKLQGYAFVTDNEAVSSAAISCFTRHGFETTEVFDDYSNALKSLLNPK